MPPPQGKSRAHSEKLSPKESYSNILFEKKKNPTQFLLALLMWVKSLKVSTQLRTSPWWIQHKVWPLLGSVRSCVSWGCGWKFPLPVTPRGSILLECLPHPHPPLLHAQTVFKVQPKGSLVQFPNWVLFLVNKMAWIVTFQEGNSRWIFAFWEHSPIPHEFISIHIFRSSWLLATEIDFC